MLKMVDAYKKQWLVNNTNKTHINATATTRSGNSKAFIFAQAAPPVNDNGNYVTSLILQIAAPPFNFKAPHNFRNNIACKITKMCM